MYCEYRKEGKLDFAVAQSAWEAAAGTPAKHKVTSLLMVVDGGPDHPADLSTAFDIALWIRYFEIVIDI